MKKLPAWAVEIRAIMAEYRMTNRQVAAGIGKSEQWVSNVLTGYKENEQTKQDICAYVRSAQEALKAS